LENHARWVLKVVTAGAAAVWVMDRFDWFAFEHEDQQARQRTESVRPGGMDPAHALAAKAATAAGTDLKPAPPHQHPAGLAVHYLLPILLAGLYDLLKHRFPVASTGGGALYSASTFLVIDELFSPLLGLAASPVRYPWQRHVRELAAHIIYGVTMHAVMCGLEARSSDGDAHQRAA
jgi:hypothetical protein